MADPTPTTSTPPAAPLRPVTDIHRFTTIIASAFHSTPLTNTFISEIDKTPPPFPSPLITLERRYQHFAGGIRDAANSGAELVESSWSAIAMWEPPNYEVLSFPSSPLRQEWKARLAKIRPKSCYHLQFLARNPDIHVPGSITAVIQPYLDRAKAEGVPAWLEAVDARSVRLYERFGFRLVEKVTVGQGQVNALGWPEEGGEGVSGWCMIRDPKP